MGTDKRRLVQTIIYEAFERFETDAAARRQFVRERCAEDSALLTVAMAEVAAEEKIRRGGFMEKPAAAMQAHGIPDGTEIDDYRIVTLLGEGGMGAVYKARQISLDRDVAVKFLRSQLAPQAKTRFLLEARTLSRIDSARVVHVYAYGDYQGQPYIVMEYSEGANLAQLIADGRMPDVRSRLAIALQIAEGLEHIHLANIAHRDVKPSNVFVDVTGKIKLIDFGIAWREDARMTEAGQVLGTPAYMPPELIQRLPSASDVELYQKADIYSFGILLFELLTGSLPFKGEARGEIEREIVNTPVPLGPLKLSHVPEPVIDLIRRTTAKSPSARPRSFEEVAAVLRGEISGATRRPRQRAVWLAAAAAALVTIVLILIPMAARTPHPIQNPVVLPPVSTTSAAPVVQVPAPAPAEPPKQRSEPSARPETKAPISAAAQPLDRLPAPVPSGDPVEAANPPVRVETVIPKAPEPVPPPVLRSEEPSPEAVQEREWARVREANDTSALRAFLDTYPSGPHARDARTLLAQFVYDAIKSSGNPADLEDFARKYPDEPQARTALSIAHQLEARAKAVEEIRQTLDSYTAAYRAMKIDRVARYRELDSKQRSYIETTFSEALSVELTMTPVALPEFERAVLADPAADAAVPTMATLTCDYALRGATRRGEPYRQNVRMTVHLKRTDTGWKITSLL